MRELLLPFTDPVQEGTFLRREKRFRVEAELDGKRVWTHTNNSGSMMGLLNAGTRALFSLSPNPKRKLPYTLELLELFGFWVGVNTLTPNRMLKAAYHAGALPEMRDYTSYTPEKKIGKSRIDAFLQGSRGDLYVEAKNVTMVEDDVAVFPDAVTERGQKHMRELMQLAGQGVRVAVFFCIQRPDGQCFGPADYVDPEYARLFYEALDAGVEMWPYRAEASPEGIGLGERVPIRPRD
jgi:sugar fermentation stimulation protein A